MHYPDDFKALCRELFPRFEALHKHLANGNPFAGRLLDDASYGGISTAEVLRATSLASLRHKAADQDAKRELYAAWGALYRQQHPHEEA